MLHLELQPELEARIAAEAHARGLEVERYLEELVISGLPTAPRSETPAEAVAAIRKLRAGLNLGGISVKELINEGRKY